MCFDEEQSCTPQVLPAYWWMIGRERVRQPGPSSAPKINTLHPPSPAAKKKFHEFFALLELRGRLLFLYQLVFLLVVSAVGFAVVVKSIDQNVELIRLSRQ